MPVTVLPTQVGALQQASAVRDATRITFADLSEDEQEVLEAFPNARRAAVFLRTLLDGPATTHGTPTLRALAARIGYAGARCLGYYLGIAMGVDAVQGAGAERGVLAQQTLAQVKRGFSELGWWMTVHRDLAPFADVSSGGADLSLTADGYAALVTIEAWDPVRDILETNAYAPLFDVNETFGRLLTGTKIVRPAGTSSSRR